MADVIYEEIIKYPLDGVYVTLTEGVSSVYNNLILKDRGEISAQSLYF